MGLSFPVSEGKNIELLNKMQKLGVREEDIVETFVKSSGKGGQNINKTNTCVQLFHKPSGLTVRCSIYRTQGLNRYKARRILCDQIELITQGKDSSIQKRIKRIQKRKKDKKRKQKKNSFTDLAS